MIDPGVAAALREATCVWREDEDGNWETACGEMWVFTEGGPKENRCRFCMYCGKALDALLGGRDDGK